MAEESASSNSNSNSNSNRPPLMLYNTMTKKKEVFVPKVPNKVGMYVCGVTAYDFSHIGHARAYVAFDVLFRLLKYLGYEVTYVRNFTDVDDKVRFLFVFRHLYKFGTINAAFTEFLW